MITYNLFEGRALCIAIGTLLVFLVFAGGAGALSNGKGGSWLSGGNITISHPGASFPIIAKADGADVRSFYN